MAEITGTLCNSELCSEQPQWGKDAVEENPVVASYLSLNLHPVLFSSRLQPEPILPHLLSDYLA